MIHLICADSLEGVHLSPLYTALSAQNAGISGSCDHGLISLPCFANSLKRQMALQMKKARLRVASLHSSHMTLRKTRPGSEWDGLKAVSVFLNITQH